MGWEVDEVVRERLREGRRLGAMGGGGGVSPIRAGGDGNRIMF